MLKSQGLLNPRPKETKFGKLKVVYLRLTLSLL